MHTAGRDLFPSRRQRQTDVDSGNCGIFHAGVLSLANEQVVRTEERFLLFFTAYKQWAVKNCGNGVEARLLND